MNHVRQILEAITLVPGVAEFLILVRWAIVAFVVACLLSVVATVIAELVR